jgi:N-acyl homoserine lactone hydrolase
VAGLRIHTLPIVKLRHKIVRAMYLADVIEPQEFNAYIWYLEGAREKILVDAGVLAQTMIDQGLPVDQIASPEEALKTIGITPDDIDLVICTHLHIDHMESGRLYKNARFIVQKAELEAAYHPHSIEAIPYPSTDVFEGLDFEVIDGDTQVSKGIKIISTPGHTRGGQSPVIETEKGKVIISGLCTTRYNFLPPQPMAKSMPVIPPSIHLDVREAWNSLIRIKNEADIIIPLHDGDFAIHV